MFINFVHPLLNPQIESSTVSSEGFEVSNLISDDPQLLQKGFLAERFISSWVTVRFKFICPVNLKNVVIWPQVGSQKSSGFELSIVNDEDECRRFASIVMPSNYDGILFHKEGVKVNYNVFAPEVKSFATSTFFRNKLHENVKTLQVKIFKSHFVPAIKKIQVWGEPHRFCDIKMKNTVRQLWSRTQHFPVYVEQKPTSINGIHNECSLPLDDRTIPEEFYDEITHELMSLPMILPSGKIVDYRTLDKFQTEEAKWGRLPSDPFTGVPFTDRSKPTVATFLKSKIDSFLLKYSDAADLKYLPRRLGSQNEKFVSPEFRISKIIEPEDGKRRLNGNDETPASKIRKIGEIEESINSLTAIGVDDDLNRMLDKTLSNLPSFIANSPSDKKCDFIKCQRCSISLNLYKLPCSHILCRSCLSNVENKCVNCNEKYTTAVIQKIHVNRSRDYDCL